MLWVSLCITLWSTRVLIPFYSLWSSAPAPPPLSSYRKSPVDNYPFPRVLQIFWFLSRGVADSIGIYAPKKKGPLPGGPESLEPLKLDACSESPD